MEPTHFIIGHISIGIKNVDPRGHHCKTKMPLFVRSLENDIANDVGYFQGVQSSDMCTICIMADARDKSKMYSELFSDFYKYMDSLQVSGIAESEDGPYLHPMVVSYPWTRHQLQKKTFLLTSLLCNLPLFDKLEGRNYALF